MKFLSTFFALSVTCCAAEPTAEVQSFLADPIERYNHQISLFAESIQRMHNDCSKFTQNLALIYRTFLEIKTNVITNLRCFLENETLENQARTYIYVFLFNTKEILDTMRGIFANNNRNEEDANLNFLLSKAPQHLKALVTNEFLLEKIKHPSQGTGNIPSDLKEFYRTQKEAIFHWFEQISPIVEKFNTEKVFWEDDLRSLEEFLDQLVQPFGKITIYISHLLQTYDYAKLSQKDKRIRLKTLKKITAQLRQRLEASSSTEAHLTAVFSAE